jgi:hypothetical protein
MPRRVNQHPAIGDNKFVDALRVVGSPSAAPRGPASQKQ